MTDPCTCWPIGLLWGAIGGLLGLLAAALACMARDPRRAEYER